MKNKNLFYAVAMLLFVASLFISCEPQGEVQKPEAFAIDSVYLYGNCTDLVNNREDGRFGMNQPYTMATATMLNGSELAARGTKIIGVRALIAGEVSDAEVYVSSEKDLENVLARKSFAWVDEGWQYILFDEPVEITGVDLYVGYKITSTGFVIGLEPASKMIDTEYMWWNNTWYKLSDMGTKGYWSIQAILQGGDYSAETQYAVSIDNALVPDATRASDEFKAILEIRNAGVRTIAGVDVITNVGGKETTIQVDKVLTNGQTAKVEVMVPVGEAEGTIDFAVKAKVKGQEIVSEEYKTTLNVYAGLERNAILIEQFTGQSCTNCPAGAAAIKKALSELTNPEQVCWVAHHTYLIGVGDAFTIPGTMDVASVLGVNAAPQCNINRSVMKYDASARETLIWHPGYITSSLLASLIPMPADATIELNREFKADSRELKVSVKGKSLKDVAYVTVIVNQDNMVASQAGAVGDYYHTSPRAFLTSSLGDKLTLDAEGNYSVEYTYTIPEKVGGFDCVLEDMEVVAFVHGDIKDNNNREVYNADKIDILK